MTFQCLIHLLVTITTLSDHRDSVKSYAVKKAPQDLTLTGKGDDPRWKNASILSDFSYPWEVDTALPTKFRALHSEHWLYCLFEVTDPAVNIRTETNNKYEVASSSRAEIFFKIDDELDPYYCLEIDPLGRVLDYQAQSYRKFDQTWEWPKDQLVVKTSRSEDGYTIEIALSKRSLRDLNLLHDNTLKAGLFRADCAVNPSGETVFKWVSWVRPDSATPDFHIPSSFGLFQLTN